MITTYKSKSLTDLSSIATKIITHFNNEKVIIFKGEMGAGKTTLIKKICSLLGVQELTSSPTFSIVNEYLTVNQNSIYHFDFYRIETEEEVLDFGYEDYFYSDSYCFIEWPEKIPNLLPKNVITIEISLDANFERIIAIKS